MKDFASKAAKGAAGLGKGALKAAISGIISEIVSDLIKETGVEDLAKDKVMEIGLKVAKDQGMSPQSIQKDLLKTAIKKEMGL